MTNAEAQSLMGVSSLLAVARTVIKLEDREHEVKESRDGNIQVDGEPLTFETWAKISGSDDSISSYDKQHEFKNEFVVMLILSF